MRNLARNFVTAFILLLWVACVSLLIGAILASVGVGAEPEYAGPGALIPATGITVIDGDTIKCDVLLPWDVTLRNQTVRAANFDAFESKRTRRTDGEPPSEREIARGKRAAAEFEALVLAGQGVFLKPGSRDGGFGRISAEIWVYTKDGKWVECGKWMTERGHVRK